MVPFAERTARHVNNNAGNRKMKNRRGIFPGSQAGNKTCAGTKNGRNRIIYFSPAGFTGQPKTPSPKYGIAFMAKFTSECG
jgi:hypothetical protein